MNKEELVHLAENIIRKTGFESAREIYSAGYYSDSKARDIIFSGFFNGKKAVLKVYDDPRVTCEPKYLAYFLTHNTSTILTAPALYASEVISSHRGWLIMQYVEQGDTFRSPLSPDARKKFLELFHEYRNAFPYDPPEGMRDEGFVRPIEFYSQRLRRWAEAAPNARAAEELLHRYGPALSAIREAYSNRRMIWCHGHFKPKEIFCPPDEDMYYLTDFAHVNMFPEGYEFAFIIWADMMMDNDWSMEYEPWRQGIEDWLEDMRPVAARLGIADFDSLLRAALAERCLGSLLVDIPSSRHTEAEKRLRRFHINRLLQELLES